MEPIQTYASHRRYIPQFHFFVLPVLVANIIIAIVGFVRYPRFITGWVVVLATALAIGIWTARAMALRVQDRLIRLEERLRLERLLPPDLRGRVVDLKTGQLVAIRFATQLLGPSGAVDPHHAQPGRPGISRGERHGRHSQAPADEHGASRARSEVIAVAERADAAEPLAALHGEQLRGTRADCFQHDLDVLALDAIDRKWPPEQRPARPSQVDKLTGTHGGRNLGCVHADHEHAARNFATAGYRRINQEHAG